MGQLNSTSHSRRHLSDGVRGDVNDHVGHPAGNEAALVAVDSDASSPGVATANPAKVPETDHPRMEPSRKSVLDRMGLSSNRARDVQDEARRADKKRWRVSRRWSRSHVEPCSEPLESTSKALSIPQEEASDPSSSGVEPYDVHFAQDTEKAVEHAEKTKDRYSSPSLAHEDETSPSPSTQYGASSSNSSIPPSSSICEQIEEVSEPAKPPEGVTVEEASGGDGMGAGLPLPDTVSDSHHTYESPVSEQESIPDNSAQFSSSEREGQLGENQRPLPTATQLPQEERALRSFSRGGTLVVVQGVVHTTESPRTSPEQNLIPGPSEYLRTAAETTIDNGPRSQRNSMLPNFLHRRNSVTSVHSRSSSAENGGSGALSEFTQNNTAAIESGSGTTLDASTYDAFPPSTMMPPGSTVTGSESQESPRRLQSTSNSVDVLGALLSVATAATAASLLSASPQRDRVHRNASSQTTQSPFPGLATHQTLTSATHADQSASPIPALARALATANPVAAAAIAQRERERERIESERSRVRGIWRSIRERVLLGRRFQDPNRSRRQIDTDTTHGVDHTVIPDSLFSTLARAFNLDQTQDESSTSTQPSDIQEEGESAGAGLQYQYQDQEETPPDSFERFLVDLQTELRAVLSELESGENTSSRPGMNMSSDRSSNAPSALEAQGTLSPQQTGFAPFGSSFAPRSEVPPEFSIPSAANTEAGVVEQALNRQNEDGGFLTASNETATSRPGADIRTQTTDERIADRRATTATSGSRSQPVTASPVSDSSENSGRHTNLNSRGVNWWRMYRFPPMRINQARHRAPVSTTNLGESNPSVGNPPSENSEPPLSSTMPNSGPVSTRVIANESMQPDPSTFEPNRSAPSLSADNNIVVPVIVVGLQSLSAPRPGRTGHNQVRPGESAPQLNAELGDGGAVSEEGSGAGVATEHAEMQRGRNWQARAARMLNRVGRRSGVSDSGNNGQAVSSSRTFFIYVIGGYYPPDHQIVTGSDYLDSFEALWDLAELLGQAKPPVATDEEVRSSGLEIIKANALEEYERTNDVASNCVERCLICLDDYESEDDIRLMTCKHAFHKTCVDHWLTTGRNNCPACRSQGVKTSDD